MTLSPPRIGHGSGNMVGYGNYLKKREHVNITFAGKLPHWEQDNVAQFITFRLADSLPQSKLDEFKCMKEEWLLNHPKPWSLKEQEDYEDLFDQIDIWLNNGYGKCILKFKEIQDIVENSLKYLDGKKYELYDYIIMPNHVHMLIIPSFGIQMRDVMKSIKGFTGYQINKLFGSKGKVWQKESFDRLIRSSFDFETKSYYIRHNGDFLGREVSRLP